LDWGFLVLIYRIVHSAVLRSTSLKEQLYRLRRRMWAPDSAIKLQEVWEGWTPNISLNERRHQMPCILPNFGVLDRCHLWIVWSCHLASLPISSPLLARSCRRMWILVCHCIHRDDLQDGFDWTNG
jgi:hypothetical protein